MHFQLDLGGLTGSQWSSWGPSSSSMVANALQAASWTCLLWSITPLRMPCMPHYPSPGRSGQPVIENEINSRGGEA